MSAKHGPRLQIDGSMAVFTLDRPDRGNALSIDLVEAGLAAVDAAVRDPQVHTLVLRGAGRHFCTGFDLSELDSESDATLLARVVRIEQLLDAVWRAPLRTVAIAQGRIMGAGADLFAVCDHRLLSAAASLRFPGAGFGLVLGTRRLGRRVGADRALRWVSEGTTIDAAQALSTGLASALLPDDVDAASAQALALLPPLTVDRVTHGQLRAALDDGGADADLAALVRSAARPGLKQRIVSYRERQLAARAPG
ncbi:MAG: enoyl-CoA hydratase/isomerase family protein [Burkholderiaceae bacterium]